MKKYIFSTILVLAGIVMSATSVLAHAVVKPNTAGVGSFTDFTLGVPSEKESSTVMVKLMLPVGLVSVSPIVKQGWRVEIKQGPVPAGVTLAPDDDGMVPTTMPTEIDWTGGAIPTGQKDFFMFSAQVPATPTELDWKIIQTYSDGSTISWTIGGSEQQPKDKDGKPDFSQFGPYSKTMVVNDLTNTPAVKADSSTEKTTTIAVIALVISILSLGWQAMKK